MLPNHVVDQFPDVPDEWKGRATLARRAECSRSSASCAATCRAAWQEYKRSGTINGVPLPAGMQESEKLPVPVFTPSTKAEPGKHDENINFEDAVAMVGKETADLAREASVELYRMASELALTKGIVIADTKFELGFIDGELRICDEALTMDSSRFWPLDEVTLGATPPSFDKQPVRDYAASLGWDKTAARAGDVRRGHRRHQRPLHRGLREDHRSAALGLAWLMVSLRVAWKSKIVRLPLDETVRHVAAEDA